ncbi:transposase [Methanobrevibacter curvatus]|uniref:Transposase IS4-like domain-containing protein n=1 Tax=Methanobrevibacter curvatus TaxID=49547 RepID=A0A166DVE6_9EURY|nr:transposase [Methanobrevibacter curvatus]KZX15992.1 hypothetical protein MBCUR_01700 [Methanobrevibacter curvatus]
MENTFQSKLLDKDYKIDYSTSKGYYAGFQMTITIDHDSLKPLPILIHPGSPHDTKMFDEIMFELQRRRILRKGQLIS